MKIKYLYLCLSILFGTMLFMSSCLSDPNGPADESRYDDSRITTFVLDTVEKGLQYRFVIDQEKNLIYNPDSMLPIHANKLKDITIVILSNASSGVVYKKNSNGTEEALFSGSKIDLTKPVTIVSLAVNGQKKEYKVEARVHSKHPEHLNWGKQRYANLNIGNAKGLKLLEANNKMLIFAKNINKAYVSNIEDSYNYGVNWREISFNISTLNTANVVAYKDWLYTTDDSGNIYKSNDGENWEQCNSLGGRKIVALIANVDTDKENADNKFGICGIEERSGKKYFCATTQDAMGWKEDVNEEKEVPENFPTKDFSYTTKVLSNKEVNIACVGNDETEYSDKSIWLTEDGTTWNEIKDKTIKEHLSKTENPNIMWYNNKYYIVGVSAKGGLGSFISSNNLFEWKKEDFKFSLPGYTYTDREKKELNGDQYSGKGIYSKTLSLTVRSDKNNFVWIVTGKGGEGDIWRGRVNKLGYKQ